MGSSHPWDASLYVTFYAKSGEEHDLDLVELLLNKLKLSPFNETPYYKAWTSKGDRPDILLYAYASPLASDTVMVQLVLQEPEINRDAGEAWFEISKKLDTIIDDNLLENVRGYTLVFVGLTEESFDSSFSKTEEDLGKSIKKLIEKRSIDIRQVIESEIENGQGKIRLVSNPKFEQKEISQREKAIIYVALFREEKASDWVDKYLYGDQAILVNHDLIVHKAYYIKFQYHPRKGEIDKIIHGLKDISEKMLGKELRFEKGYIRKISEASIKLNYLIFALHGLRISMKQQEFNYKNKKKNYILEGAIASYYEDALEEISLGLDILIEQCSRTPDTITKTIELINAQVKEHDDETEQRWQKLAAVVAAALAVPQLVDSSAAWFLLQPFLPFLETINLHMQGSETFTGGIEQRIAALVMQILLIFVVALLLNFTLEKLVRIK